MARRDQVTRRGAIAAARELAARPDLVHVKHVAKIHARSTTAGTCPCCGSPTAKIVDEFDDLEVLIDVENGQRWLRSLPPNTRGADLLVHQVAADVDVFDELAATADAYYEVPLRVASHCIDLVFDNAITTTLATGAARSSKTQHSVVWMQRQWALRGGPGKLFLLAGPSVELAFVLHDKWIVGEGLDNPPVCPADLVVARPASMRETNPTIEMLDGSRIRIRHTANANRLGGRRYEAIAFTEASGTKGDDAYTQLRGRIVSSQGVIFMDAVPKAKSWVLPAVVQVGRDEDEAEALATKRGESFARSVRVQHLASADNPWVNEDEAKAFRADLQRVNRRAAAREADGMWVGDTDMYFSDVFDGARHAYEYEGFNDVCRFLGLEDITRQASQRWFANPHDWLAGVDINANPHSALAYKIAAPKKADPRDPESWILVAHAVLQTWRDPIGRAAGDKKANDSAEAADLLRKEWDGILEGAGIIIDGTSTYPRQTAGGVGNARRNAVPKIDYERAGFEVRGPMKFATPRKPGGPRNFCNPSLVDSGAVVRRLFRDNKILINRLHGAGRLVRAVQEQETDATGLMPLPLKVSGTDQDRYVASLIDCLRYGAWPFFERSSTPASANRFVQYG